MEKLFEKLNILKETLDETQTIKEIKKLNQELASNQVLLSLVEKYNLTKDERLKEKIINNDLFRRYKHQETELNILILEINQVLKKITNKDKCGL